MNLTKFRSFCLAALCVLLGSVEAGTAGVPIKAEGRSHGIPLASVKSARTAEKIDLKRLGEDAILEVPSHPEESGLSLGAPRPSHQEIKASPRRWRRAPPATMTTAAVSSLTTSSSRGNQNKGPDSSASSTTMVVSLSQSTASLTTQPRDIKGNACGLNKDFVSDSTGKSAACNSGDAEPSSPTTKKTEQSSANDNENVLATSTASSVTCSCANTSPSSERDGKEQSNNGNHYGQYKSSADSTVSSPFIMSTGTVQGPPSANDNNNGRQLGLNKDAPATSSSSGSSLACVCASSPVTTKSEKENQNREPESDSTSARTSMSSTAKYATELKGNAQASENGMSNETGGAGTAINSIRTTTSQTGRRGDQEGPEATTSADAGPKANNGASYVCVLAQISAETRAIEFSTSSNAPISTDRATLSLTSSTTVLSTSRPSTTLRSSTAVGSTSVQSTSASGTPSAATTTNAPSSSNTKAQLLANDASSGATSPSTTRGCATSDSSAQAGNNGKGILNANLDNGNKYGLLGKDDTNICSETIAATTRQSQDKGDNGLHIGQLQDSISTAASTSATLRSLLSFLASRSSTASAEGGNGNNQREGNGEEKSSSTPPTTTIQASALTARTSIIPITSSTTGVTASLSTTLSTTTTVKGKGRKKRAPPGTISTTAPPPSASSVSTVTVKLTTMTSLGTTMTSTNSAAGVQGGVGLTQYTTSPTTSSKEIKGYACGLYKELLGSTAGASGPCFKNDESGGASSSTTGRPVTCTCTNEGSSSATEDINKSNNGNHYGQVRNGNSGGSGGSSTTSVTTAETQNKGSTSSAACTCANTGMAVQTTTIRNVQSTNNTTESQNKKGEDDEGSTARFPTTGSVSTPLSTRTITGSVPSTSGVFSSTTRPMAPYTALIFPSSSRAVAGSRTTATAASPVLCYQVMNSNSAAEAHGSSSNMIYNGHDLNSEGTPYDVLSSMEVGKAKLVFAIIDPITGLLVTVDPPNAGSISGGVVGPSSTYPALSQGSTSVGPSIGYTIIGDTSNLKGTSTFFPRISGNPDTASNQANIDALSTAASSQSNMIWLDSPNEQTVSTLLPGTASLHVISLTVTARNSLGETDDQAHLNSGSTVAVAAQSGRSSLGETVDPSNSNSGGTTPAQNTPVSHSDGVFATAPNRQDATAISVTISHTLSSSTASSGVSDYDQAHLSSDSTAAVTPQSGDSSLGVTVNPANSNSGSTTPVVQSDGNPSATQNSQDATAILVTNSYTLSTSAASSGASDSQGNGGNEIYLNAMSTFAVSRSNPDADVEAASGRGSSTLAPGGSELQGGFGDQASLNLVGTSALSQRETSAVSPQSASETMSQASNPTGLASTQPSLAKSSELTYGSVSTTDHGGPPSSTSAASLASTSTSVGFDGEAAVESRPSTPLRAPENLDSTTAAPTPLSATQTTPKSDDAPGASEYVYYYYYYSDNETLSDYHNVDGDNGSRVFNGSTNSTSFPSGASQKKPGSSLQNQAAIAGGSSVIQIQSGGILQNGNGVVAERRVGAFGVQIKVKAAAVTTSTTTATSAGPSASGGADSLAAGVVDNSGSADTATQKFGSMVTKAVSRGSARDLSGDSSKQGSDEKMIIAVSTSVGGCAVLAGACCLGLLVAKVLRRRKRRAAESDEGKMLPRDFTYSQSEGSCDDLDKLKSQSLSSTQFSPTDSGAGLVSKAFPTKSFRGATPKLAW